MPRYVLGTHVSHNGSSCLLADGKVVVAIEKERLTRVKHDGGNDNATVQYCLAAAGICIDDVELVVQNANLHMFEAKGWSRCGDRIVDGARRLLTVSHHLAHAYSAVGTCPFDDMAVLVIDGCGNAYADAMDKEGALIPEKPVNAELEQLYFEKDSFYHFSQGTLTTIWKDFSPWGTPQRYPMEPFTTMHSIGGAYNAASKYVFRGMDDPGKLMGLAPFGRAGRFAEEIFGLRDGRVFLNRQWMKTFLRPAESHADFLGNFQYYADVAFYVQREVERALLYVVAHRRAMLPVARIAYAGGVGLNAVANRLLAEEAGFKQWYIQPAAGDNGLAIGAAYFGWLRACGRDRVRHFGGTHFGKSYGADETAGALARCGPQVHAETVVDVAARAAELLLEGKVFGWFTGGAEFGPRALGHRSILALPGDPAIKEFINSRIKFREDFRPFAPAVLYEDASEFFEVSDPLPYMLVVTRVREHWRDRLMAVVHRDGTARIQTVHREITPLFHELLRALKERGALPIVLNTSLNRRGRPIVETPVEALELLTETALDGLMIDGFYVTKTKVRAVSRLSATDSEYLARLSAKFARGGHGGSPSGGVMQLEISSTSSWTVDWNQGGVVAPGRVLHPDHTVVVGAGALGELAEGPERLPGLLEEGRLKLRGTALDHADDGRARASLLQLAAMLRATANASL